MIIVSVWTTKIFSSRQVALGSRDQSSLPARLAQTQHVAGGIAEGAVADAVELVRRLLQHLATRGADALEGRLMDQASTLTPLPTTVMPPSLTV
jgi:hypothetical protein